MDALEPLEVDLVSVDDLRALAGTDGPWLSVSMPTHRRGVETLQGPIRLRNLLDEAERELRAAGVANSELDGWLARPRALQDDQRFWQHLAEGLVIWSAPGAFRTVRLPHEAAETVVVSPVPRVRPVLPLLGSDGTFLILALGEKGVRLLEATAHAVRELDLGPIPSSKAEALAYEDHERQLQYHSAGGNQAAFHGHGVGAELDKAELERYFRAVDDGLARRLGDRRDPLVLACVGYYEPIFASVSRYPALVRGAVEGNPDRRSAQELQQAAWPLVEPLFTRARADAVARYREVAGTGRTTTSIDEIVPAAAQGRVGTLLVAQDAPAHWGVWDRTSGTVELAPERRPFDGDLVDAAVLETLATGGEVHAIDEPIDGATVAAILRY